MEEMDLGEWELLPRNYNSFDHLVHDGDDEDGATRRNPNPNPKNLLDMDHFICPSQHPPNRRSDVVPTTQLVQVPMTWEPVFSADDTDQGKTKTKSTDGVSVVVPATILENPNPGPLNPNPDPDPGLLADPVPSPQVSFKRMKENEFVDMKIDPTRVANPSPSPRPQIDLKPKPLDSDDKKKMIGSEGEDDGDLRIKEEGWGEDLIGGNGGEKLNLWKLGVTGIGAICSFGVAAAAATICVFLFGNNNNNKNCRNKNQMLRFQIYSDDDKRVKEVVRHATKLNEAISAMKGGVPVVRAQITLGGYYNAL